MDNFTSTLTECRAEPRFIVLRVDYDRDCVIRSESVGNETDDNGIETLIRVEDIAAAFVPDVEAGTLMQVHLKSGNVLYCLGYVDALADILGAEYVECEDVEESVE